MVKFCATVLATAALSVSVAGCSYPSNVSKGTYRCTPNAKIGSCNLIINDSKNFSTSKFLYSETTNLYTMYKNAKGTYTYSSNNGNWKGTLTSGQYCIYENGTSASIKITKNNKYYISASYKDSNTILFKTFYYRK